ncbi:MAG: HAMP domain-containing histidine kinase [Lachnospiraceae bacterium]|nr:HAMP domain-containing histidine kinase [Lachnospiraceae bacterium]
MFKKSRIKIVALLMAILLLTLLGTIAVIYGVSYREMNQENRDMLVLYANEYLENGGLPDSAAREDGSGDILPEKDDIQGISRRRLELSTFYSVVFSANGSVLQVNNDDPSQISDEMLTELAQSFLETGKSYGISRNMVYLVSGEEYVLVSMMDNTVIGESIVTLLRYTVIFGVVAVIVVLILAIFLSGWIIRPLEENYRRQNQFISDAGHELKTPVSTISTNAELLQREIGENRWLDNIRYENGRMMEIVCSLLDLLRAESLAPQAAQMQRLDLGRAITAGTLPFEARAFEEGFDLSCEIADGIFVMGEEAQLGKLISILLDNALAHTKPSGRIQVSLESIRGLAALTVSNEGDPIPAESMDRIFDRFYRVDSSRTVRAQDGAAQAHYGLGLSIAKAIATAHRAKISVNCGDGMTKFTVVFPLRVK